MSGFNGNVHFFGMNIELLIADITEPKCQYLLKIKAKNQLKRIPLFSCAQTTLSNQMYNVVKLVKLSLVQCIVNVNYRISL